MWLRRKTLLLHTYANIQYTDWPQVLRVAELHSLMNSGEDVRTVCTKNVFI